MADRSYPRSGRLTKPFQFERVLRAPEVSAAAGSLRLRATPNRICSARLGVVVAKRVLRRAVDRNRTKRQIREVFRLLRAELPALDIVIRLVPSSSNRNSLDVASIRQAANELLGSLGK